MSTNSNALTTFSPAEVVRLLDRRSDGAQAAVMLQALNAMPGMQVLGVELREDEAVVAIEIRYIASGDGETGPWTSFVLGSVIAPLGPLTRKDLSYNMPVIFNSEDLASAHALHVVAVGGYVSPLTPVLESHDDAS